MSVKEDVVIDGMVVVLVEAGMGGEGVNLGEVVAKGGSFTFAVRHFLTIYGEGNGLGRFGV